MAKYLNRIGVIGTTLTLAVTFLVVIFRGISYFFHTAPCVKCNIIIIAADSLRADALPCFGYSKPTAPNICTYAKNSSLFTRAYANSPWTRPSNISVMTSLYPSSHGMVDSFPNELNPNIITLPHILSTHGYTTRFVASDLNDMGIELGYGRMFQHTQLTSPSMDDETMNDWLYAIDRMKDDNTQHKPAFVFFYTGHIHEYVNAIFSTPKIFPLDPGYRPRPLPKLTQFTDKTWTFTKHYLEEMTRTLRIESVVNRHKVWLNQFEQALSLSDARTIFASLPTQIQEDIYRNFAQELLHTEYFDAATLLYRHLYDEQIRTFDLSIAKLFDRIDKNGLSNSTIVVMYGDHGQLIGEHHLLAQTGNIFNEEIHVPLIIHVPKMTGMITDALTQHIDIFPTLLDLVGIGIPEPLQGISLVGAMRNKKDAAINTFVVSHATKPTQMYSIRTDRWRLMEALRSHSTYRELYDFADPNKTTSVASTNQEAVERLARLLYSTLAKQPRYSPITSTILQWKTIDEREAREKNKN